MSHTNQTEIKFKEMHYQANSCSKPVLQFTPKHVWSIKNNTLAGISFPMWCWILRLYGCYIEPQYFFRAFYITCMSLFVSFLGIIETLLYGYLISQVELPEDPVFILGHWRTGTTFLHNTLSSDEETFFYNNVFCTSLPNSFLWFEGIGKFLLSGAVDKTRPMDNMPLHFELPHEDEFATNVVSGGLSYYLALFFPQQEPSLRKYLTFEEGSEDEKQWVKSFQYFFKKVCLREKLLNGSSTGKRLLIKSPVHTARIPLLRKLFPKAQFLYIHRQPDSILRSTAHLVDTANWYLCFNTASNTQLTDYIFWQFEELWKTYNSAALLPSTQQQVGMLAYNGDIKNATWRKTRAELLCPDIMEIGYTEMTRETIPVLKRIYNFLNIPWDDARQGKVFHQEVHEASSYKTNSFEELSPALKSFIRERWNGYFEAFHYK